MADNAEAVIHLSLVDGVYHVYAQTNGASEEASQKLAERILWFLAENRLAFIRCEPMASTEKNFDQQTVSYPGYVRFAFKDERGKWQKPSEEVVVSVGFSLPAKDPAA